ncbi:Alpha/Beta hydrolase protein [Xylogone sp. PMI_703]|nr:Alpha/Beta hydrolase protein [Xylogone sp. PMI_703]
MHKFNFAPISIAFALVGIFDLVPAFEVVNVNVLQPESNAPLDTALAYYKLPGHNAGSQFLTHAFIPLSCGANLSVHYTEPSVYGSLTGTPKKPVLLLTHGFPESSYMWRRSTQALSERVPLFALDQPGYGLSTPCNTGTDQLTNAQAMVEALTSIYGNGTTIILSGHDRGARIMQRLAVHINEFPQVRGLGVFLIEIVPLVEQYSSFSDPSKAARYFHFPLLSRADIATDIVMAYGGGNFAKAILTSAGGSNTVGRALFTSDNAFDVYATFFDQLSVTNATVFDFATGATFDYQREAADQAAGRKISMPTHVLYAVASLETAFGFNVSEVWSRYVNPSAKLTTYGIGNGYGHFIVEEAPDQTVAQLNNFMDRLGVN